MSLFCVGGRGVSMRTIDCSASSTGGNLEGGGQTPGLNRGGAYLLCLFLGRSRSTCRNPGFYPVKSSVNDVLNRLVEQKWLPWYRQATAAPNSNPLAHSPKQEQRRAQQQWDPLLSPLAVKTWQRGGQSSAQSVPHCLSVKHPAPHRRLLLTLWMVNAATRGMFMVVSCWTALLAIPLT